MCDMQNLMVRIKPNPNTDLTDDEFVAEVMKMMQAKWPVITGWTYERDGEYINLLMWGEHLRVSYE